MNIYRIRHDKTGLHNRDTSVENYVKWVRDYILLWLHREGKRIQVP